MNQRWCGAFLTASCWLVLGCGQRSPGRNGQSGGSLQPLPESTWALLPFEKAAGVNPVMGPDTAAFYCPVRRERVAWEVKDVFNPAMVVRDGKIWMLYRAQDSLGKPGGTSRIGLAHSSDGLHFTRLPAPVLYPDKDAQQQLEWEGGCEDPRITEDSSGTYYMTYTAFDGAKARLMVALSRDLEHWSKKGPAFATAYGGKYANAWSKSGSIVSTYTKEGRILATRIRGRYWMYWGDQYIWAATSDDLVHWTPVEMASGEVPPVTLRGEALHMPQLKIVVPTRAGYFDSDLVESGPPAMLTDKGILLIYNGRNLHASGDTSLAEGTYSGGQVLLDKEDPTKVLARMEHNFIHPDQPYEISGQVNQVCFLEGLVSLNNNWFLYYGTADSKIAVATMHP